MATAASTANTSVQDLERRLLRYADALKAPTDLVYPCMEAAFGIKLDPPADAAHSWHEVKQSPLANGFLLHATHSPAEKGFSASRSHY
ncbi:hypothetical protein [Xanthomonas sp. 1678]|uniref:hypothetical protein n=1 Tax=Xanthomonas sp. 1678 TaxID=3158788 RepID=UPI00285C95A7|nr:hypothetical protein [Xanthomonas translucens]